MENILTGAVWADDDWLKKFSGKTLEENKEEEGLEPPRVETREGEPTAKNVRSNPMTMYMDIKIGNKPAGRIRMLLHSDVVPMTAGPNVCSRLPSKKRNSGKLPLQLPGGRSPLQVRATSTRDLVHLHSNLDHMLHGETSEPHSQGRTEPWFPPQLRAPRPEFSHPPHTFGGLDGSCPSGWEQPPGCSKGLFCPPLPRAGP
uniref:uncharacterized protein LOC118542534 isoform X4 n=1 Tax=Halichoerus grypus TaxID=9711 RepID=UPI001659C935|nr:uncharacterized protein LOC118542534 isoform X4 [Halichoerus grypus]